MSDHSLESIRKKCAKLGLGGDGRVILICMDAKTGKCASAKQMHESWKYLKHRLKELRLGHRSGVVRVKMGCAGICRGGPIVAVMPDGVWYGRRTPKAIERIIQEHLVGGQIVKEHLIAE